MRFPETVLHLRRDRFTRHERILLEFGPLVASAFEYESGVAALRLTNEVGEIVLLPFHGQQIWTAEFRGRELAMKSMFDQPRNTRDYLANYGGFLLHCGATAMGVPGPEDEHPLHGELPNAPYQEAHLHAGADENGPYVGLSGLYQDTVAFSHNYVAEPMVRLYSASTVLKTSVAITNLSNSDMELMYLAHINFRPVDNGRLVYSAHPTPENVRVRRSVPAHVKTKPGYREFIERLGKNPEEHHVLSPDLVFDPEAVFSIDYEADQEGWAHTMQVHPDGTADYVRHRPEQLDVGVRWICRTADQDALGIVLPATAEPEGYTAEKAKGNIKTLPAHEQFYCEYEMGSLTADEARQVQAAVDGILAQ